LSGGKSARKWFYATCSWQGDFGAILPVAFRHSITALPVLSLPQTHFDIGAKSRLDLNLPPDNNSDLKYIVENCQEWRCPCLKQAQAANPHHRNAVPSQD
jgi:hypothetical protein